VPLLGPGAKILESGKVIWRAGRPQEAAPEVVLAGDEAARVVFKVGSGAYSFEVRT
jgi:hypothetical protein